MTNKTDPTTCKITYAIAAERDRLALKAQLVCSLRQHGTTQCMFIAFQYTFVLMLRVPFCLSGSVFDSNK